MGKKHTSKLGEQQLPTETTIYQPEPVDLGMLRPWRIALFIKQVQAKLIIDLINGLTIGRADSGSETFPDIDLRPFQAESLGVSRQHLFLRLEGDSVVVIDNKTVNGTRLNGKALVPLRPYPVRHGDELALGAMELQIQMLINPLD